MISSLILVSFIEFAVFPLASIQPKTFKRLVVLFLHKTSASSLTGFLILPLRIFALRDTSRPQIRSVITGQLLAAIRCVTPLLLIESTAQLTKSFTGAFVVQNDLHGRFVSSLALAVRLLYSWLTCQSKLI